MTYPGHEVLTETLKVPYGPDSYSAMKHDFQLRQLAATTGSTTANLTQANPTTTCNHTVQQHSGGAITRPAWTRLAVGFGLLAALRSLIG